MPHPSAPTAQVVSAAQRWGLTLVERTGSRYSQTWFAMRGDEHVVLKVGARAARSREAAALLAYDSPHAPACRLLAADLDDDPGALLLERVLLGDDLRPLSATDDDRATQCAATVLAGLHRAVADRPRPAELPPLDDICRAFDDLGAAVALTMDLVADAGALARDLAVPSAGDRVLHGDAHHQNLVRDGDGGPGDTWRAIDPHGWWGDPAFDAAAYLVDLHQGGLRRDDPARLARRRAAILAEGTGLPRDRILAWGAAGAVIAELWCLRDHGFIQGGPMRLAAALLGR